MPIDLPPVTDIQHAVAEALKEDIGMGDLTATLIPDTLTASASIITRQDAILCGTAWVNEVFLQLDSSIQINWLANDGDQISPDQTLCQLEGNAATLLTGERTALNFCRPCLALPRLQKNMLMRSWARTQLSWIHERPSPV